VSGAATSSCCTGPVFASAASGIFWQSSAAEALVNSTIGLVVSWGATWLVLGYQPAAAIAVTLMFFGLSFARSWAVRALFKRMAA